jgi:hypothetical protein
MFIPDPGSDFFPSRIPDPNCLHPGSSSKNLRILTPKKPKKWFLSSKKYDPGCSSRIRMLTIYPSRIPDPGVKKAPDPGSRIRIRNTGSQGIFGFFFVYGYRTASSAAPSDSTVSEDAGIQPRSVATSALTVRRSNHSARSHPHPLLDSYWYLPTTDGKIFPPKNAVYSKDLLYTSIQ